MDCLVFQDFTDSAGSIVQLIPVKQLMICDTLGRNSNNVLYIVMDCHYRTIVSVCVSMMDVYYRYKYIMLVNVVGDDTIE